MSSTLNNLRELIALDFVTTTSHKESELELQVLVKKILEPKRDTHTAKHQISKALCLIAYIREVSSKLIDLQKKLNLAGVTKLDCSLNPESKLEVDYQLKLSERLHVFFKAPWHQSQTDTQSGTKSVEAYEKDDALHLTFRTDLSIDHKFINHIIDEENDVGLGLAEI